MTVEVGLNVIESWREIRFGVLFQADKPRVRVYLFAIELTIGVL